jgi:hypothetical protein
MDKRVSPLNRKIVGLRHCHTYGKLVFTLACGHRRVYDERVGRQPKLGKTAGCMLCALEKSRN